MACREWARKGRIGIAVQVQYPQGVVCVAVGAVHESRESDPVRLGHRHALRVGGQRPQHVLPAARRGEHDLVFMGFEPAHGEHHEQHDEAARDQCDPREALEHQCQPATASRAA